MSVRPVKAPSKERLRPLLIMDDLGRITWELELGRWLDRVKDAVGKVLPPRQRSPDLKMVVLEVSTECNRKCVYCPPHYSLGIPPLKMDWELFRGIIDSLAKNSFGGRLGFGIYGESLLDDKLEDRLSYAAARLPASLPTVYTNGDRLTVGRYLGLRKAGMAVMIISQHSPELSGALLETLKAIKRDYPEQYCVRVIDYHELYSAGRNKLGIMNNRGGLAEVKRKPPSRCRELDYPAIDCLGNVLLCCQDCTASYVFGNAGERDFFEIWNDPAFVEARRRIRSGEWLFEICRNCMSGKGLCKEKPRGHAPRLAPAFHDFRTAMASCGLPAGQKPPQAGAGGTSGGGAPENTASRWRSLAGTGGGPVKFLALGDSYTAGTFVAEKDRWPDQLAAALRLKGENIESPRIIAGLGWRTDQLKKAVDEARLENEYGLVSLLAGVNDQYHKRTEGEYGAGFAELLRTALLLAGGKKESVFVLSLPDYGFTPFGRKKQAKISTAIDRFNGINRALTEKAGIRYISITDLTRCGLARPELVAADGIHPSGPMYSLWAERIMASLQEVL